jgi:adenosylcobinamide-phosphate synthase
VFTIALLSRRPGYVLAICRRDAPADPSPNAGWSECAYAATLGVQLGGPNTYRGRLTVKPLLGEAIHPITPASVSRALMLTRQTFLLWLAVGISGLVAIGLVTNR